MSLERINLSDGTLQNCHELKIISSACGSVEIYRLQFIGHNQNWEKQFFEGQYGCESIFDEFAKFEDSHHWVRCMQKCLSSPVR